MPLIYRNIVPNVPALTAGNGKPCYRGNAPSYQRLMRFSVSWQGNPNLTPWLDYEWPDPDDRPTFWDLSLSAAEMNAAIAYFIANDPNVAWDEYCYGVGSPHSSDNGLPAGAWVEYYRLFLSTTFNSQYDIYNSGGVLTKQVRDVDLWVGLEWDAANSSWRWIARLRQLYVRFFGEYIEHNYDGDIVVPMHPTVMFTGSTARYGFFASSPSTTDIRVGNGCTMPFVQIYNPQTTGDSWRASALANTALVISATAA